MDRLWILAALCVALAGPRATGAAPDTAESALAGVGGCLREAIWAGYVEGWTVQSVSSMSLSPGEAAIFEIDTRSGREYRAFVCGAPGGELSLYDGRLDEVARGPAGGLRYLAPEGGPLYVVVRAAPAATTPSARLAIVWRAPPALRRQVIAGR